MKAYVIKKFGNHDVFEQADVAAPSPGPKDILIAVKASSVNPIDYKLRAGVLPPLCPSFPAILHGDFSGVVAAIGDEVTKFQVGDNVFGCYGGVAGKPGALAEFICVPEFFVCKKPDSLSHLEAATVPLVAFTAWEAVYKRAKLTAGGSTALVIGGAGGVGHIIVQLLRKQGVQVSATARTDKKAVILEQLGVAHVLDAEAHKIGQQALDITHGKGFDAVFDTVGDQCFVAAQAALAGEGHIVSLAAAGANDTTQAYLKGARIDLINILLPVITGIGGQDRQTTLASVSQLIEQKQLLPLIDPHHFGFSDVGAAHLHLESGNAVGKVALISDF